MTTTTISVAGLRWQSTSAVPREWLLLTGAFLLVAAAALGVMS
jgi:hypothetical protein